MPADGGVHGQTPDVRKDLGIGDEEHEGEEEDAEDEGADAFDEAAESLASGGSMLMSPRTLAANIARDHDPRYKTLEEYLERLRTYVTYANVQDIELDQNHLVEMAVRGQMIDALYWDCAAETTVEQEVELLQSYHTQEAANEPVFGSEEYPGYIVRIKVLKDLSLIHI